MEQRLGKREEDWLLLLRNMIVRKVIVRKAESVKSWVIKVQSKVLLILCPT